MKAAGRTTTLFAAAALAATACTDQGPVAPLDDEITLDQEAAIALGLLDDDLASYNFV